MAMQNSTGKTMTESTDAFFALRQHEQEAVDRAFSRLDRNGDGRISKDELRAGLIHLGETPTKRRLAELFGAVDKDCSGYIEQEEFKALMHEKFMEERLKKAYTKAAFKMLDQNGDGFVTSGEVTQVVRDVGFPIALGEIRELIRNADINGDGKVNYTEFSKALWRRMSQSNCL